MGAGAPKADTVERTLKRLVEDEHDDLSRNTGGGRQRAFSYSRTRTSMSACSSAKESYSQRSATFLINGDRSAQGLVRWCVVRPSVSGRKHLSIYPFAFDVELKEPSGCALRGAWNKALIYLSCTCTFLLLLHTAKYPIRGRAVREPAVGRRRR